MGRTKEDRVLEELEDEVQMRERGKVVKRSAMLAGQTLSWVDAGRGRSLKLKC